MANRKMKTYKIAALSLILLGLVGGSCTKSAEPYAAESNQNVAADGPLFLSFHADQEVFSEDENAPRALSYNLKATDEFRLPELTYGSATTAGSTENIPVMAFFRNKTTHQMVHVRLVFNTVKGSKKLFRSFSSIPELNSVVNQSNWNDWYVKMFIGGYPEIIGEGGNWPVHSTSLETNTRVNQVRFVYNNLWDVTPETTNVSIGTHYLTGNSKWTDYPVRPLPMETDWTKVHFTTTTGGNASYPAAGNHIVFKPIGSLLRILFHNRDAAPVRVSSASLHDVTATSTRENAMLLNHILVKLNKNITLKADGTVDQVASVTREEVTDGYVHYHFQNASNGVRGIKEIPSNSKRLFYLWVYPNPSRTGLAQQVIRPTLYLRNSNNPERSEAGTRYFRPSTEQTIQRSKYKDGKAYRIRMNWSSMTTNDVDFVVSNWEAGDDATLAPAAN